MKSKWGLHVERYGDGCGHHLCGQATKVCLARGAVPCDILFIGEAPGQSEDALGKPFCGPAGKLLDQLINESVNQYATCNTCRRGHHISVTKRRDIERNGGLLECGHGPDDADPIRFAFTNLVGCVPRDADGVKAHNPEPDQITTCADRLGDFIKLANPRVIVRVGKLAETWVNPEKKKAAKFKPVPMVEIPHPAFILRSNIANQGLLIQRAIAVLSTATEDLGSHGITNK